MQFKELREKVLNTIQTGHQLRNRLFEKIADLVTPKTTTWNPELNRWEKIKTPSAHTIWNPMTMRYEQIVTPQGHIWDGLRWVEMAEPPKDHTWNPYSNSWDKLAKK